MFILRLIEIEIDPPAPSPSSPHATIREGRILIFFVLSGQKVGKYGLILVKSRRLVSLMLTLNIYYTLF